MRIEYNMKKTVFVIICLAALLIPLTACSTTEDQSPKELSDLQVDWIDLGGDFVSVRFASTGEDLYMIEAEASDQSLKYGFIDGSGNVVIPVIYDRVTGFNEGLCSVESGDKKIFIDASGKEVIDVSEYNSVNNFEFGFASVTREQSSKTDSGFMYTYMQGLIDKSGNEVLPCEYTQAGSLEDGLLWAEKDGMYILFDKSGNKINETLYAYVGNAGEGMILVEKDGKYGYLDKSGNVAIPLQYEEAYGFFDGAAIVSDNGQMTYINSNGERLTTVVFSQVNDFCEGLAAVMNDEKFGYMDNQGKLVIPCEFDEAYSFKNGVAIVMKTIDTKPFYYAIDKNGKRAVKPKEQGYYKWNDTYVAYFNPEEGDIDADFASISLLDKSGKMISGYYSDIDDFNEGLAVAEDYGDPTFQYGIINQKGAEIIPLVFDKVEIVSSGSCVVQASDSGNGKNSKVGILTLPEDAAKRKPN